MNKTAKIDSRNIYANDSNKKKDWNSASLNMKHFVKKKDLSLFYAQTGNMKQKKSQETHLNNFRPTGLAQSAENQFQSFMKNEKQFMVNPYFPASSDFSKSFGSSIYKPAAASNLDVSNNSKLLKFLTNKITLL